ncbi:MAG TPA: FtsX-like permease family protein [Acidimicrobiales bacterium]|nr:FtsX-like permease family protein [Acidimicrobiales bacterium]
MTTRAHRALAVAAGGLLTVGLLAAGVLPVPVVVLSVPFLVVAWRRPVLRRLAFRNAARRPRETALVLLGALLGTAIITGSAIVGDTLGASIRRGAFTHLGPIDEVVRAADGQDPAALLAAVRGVRSPDIDGVLPITSVGATVAAPGPTPAAAPRAEPHATLLEVDFAAARRFGGDGGATGISGPTPAPDHAAIETDLARTLDVRPGSTVEVYAYGATRSVTVDRVLPRLGVAGRRPGAGTTAPNLFLSPGTLAAMAAAAPAGAAPPTYLVAVSNRGGVIDGAARTTPVVKALDAAVAAARLRAQVEPEKRNLLDAADAQGRDFTRLFASIGMFSALAGILLLVAIFVMLAEERKTELGMLRAVGLTRRGLIGTFSLEGWVYALGSSALGTIAGIGIGRVIVFVTSRIISRGGPFALDMHFSASLPSIQLGFVVGFVMSLATVVATSLSIARLNVIRSIRDLPEPPRARQRVAWTAVSALFVAMGTLMAVRGLAAKSPAPVLIGPAIAGLGASVVLRRVMARRWATTIAAASVLVWTSISPNLAPDAFHNPDISLFVVNGVIYTIAAVGLVSQHQQLIGRVLRRAGGGARNLSLRLGLAHPLERGFRTSTILTTFALVMFTLVAMTLFSGIFSAQIDGFTKDVSGGFALRAFSNGSNPASADAVRAVDGVSAVSTMLTAGAQFAEPAKPGSFEFWGLAGIDDSFVDLGPPALDRWLPKFSSAGDAWRAVRSDPSLIVVDDFFLQHQGGPPRGHVVPGQVVTMRDPATGAVHQLTVAAVAKVGFIGAPAYTSSRLVTDVFGARAAPDLLLVATKPGVDPQRLAETLNARFLPNGMDAVAFRTSVSEALAQQQSFLHLMQGYLALGLVVGVAGLGVVMVRSVRERRREVGVLRSLGFDAGQVRRAFLVESAFVALEGILLGALLAVVSTWRIVGSGAFGDGLRFAVPWGPVIVVVVLAFLATLVATVAPAQQASRIRPAVALRITD